MQARQVKQPEHQPKQHRKITRKFEPSPATPSARAARVAQVVGAVGALLGCAGQAQAQSVPTPLGRWVPPRISELAEALVKKMRKNGELPLDPRACPVRPEELRAVTVTHRTFDNGLQLGQIIVHESVAAEVAKIFIDLYLAGFPIRRMEPGLTEADSLKKNNTTGFSCGASDELRLGGSLASPKRLGLAVDVNPLQNPAVRLKPEARREFDAYKATHWSSNLTFADILGGFCVDRSDSCVITPGASASAIARNPMTRGGIVADGGAERVFLGYGWSWAGREPRESSAGLTARYYRFERALNSAESQ